MVCWVVLLGFAHFSRFASVHGAVATQLPFQLAPELVQSTNILITPEIDDFINGLLKEYHSPGLSIAAVRKNDSYDGGWLTEFGSYGIAKGDGSPVTPDSLFAIASNSKLFLSLSVGLLISNKTLAEERGKEITWLTKAKDLLPEWGLMDEDAERLVTVQDMLSHRTGLPRHDFSGTVRKGGVSEMISTLRFLRPSAEVRQTFQYNNLMYEALSHLPSTLLNQSYESYISEHLFQPLNMSASTYSVAEAEASGNFADGFHRSMRDIIADVDGKLTATIPYFSRPGEENIWAGAGGVITSARDLTKWIKMLLLNGRHPVTNESIVPTEVVKYAAEGVSVWESEAAYPELSPAMYGAGQRRFSYQGHEVIEHDGGNPGFTTQVARFPNDNLGLILLSNDQELGTEIHEIVRLKLAEHILGLKSIDWKTRKQEARAKRVSEKRTNALPRPSNPMPPSFSLEALEGQEFFHPTYGSLKPCYVGPRTSLSSKRCTNFINNPTSKRILESPFTINSAITEIGNTDSITIPTLLMSPFTINSTITEIGNTNSMIPTLLIPFSSFFATHILLRHFDGNIFNASTVWTNYDVRVREGFGGENPAEGDVISGLDERFEVEYVIESKFTSDSELEGFAFKGGFWGMQGKEAKAPGGYGKESAEVWFGKVTKA